METIGTYLKRQREMRKISLEEVSQTTKISLHCLKSLEADDLEALPGSIFAKGFVKSYSKAIGLNADEALLQFEEYLKTIHADQAGKNARVKWLRPGGLQLKPWVFFVVLMVMIVLVAYLTSR
ncbi:MAG: helix-turn-helix domain-containing protein [Deltaproteobacteria bacterium]|nr:helix-turn-helix domain-containing protein [Deltaproteobacteria bacterium]